MKIVIVGLSAAGLSALETIVRQSANCSVTVISEERFEPYSRCLLTHYLGKELQMGELFISNSSRFPDNVKFIFGQRVAGIDNNNKQVILDNNRSISYDKLLLATGAEPVKPVYASKSKRVFTLRHLDDANKIEGKLNNSATVVGGGFVGIKTAYGLIEREVKVNLVISSGYPLSVILDEETGLIVEKELAHLGISVITHSDIAELEDKVSHIKATLSSELTLKSDVVIVGKGVTPRTELATSSGIKVNKGIVVNEYLETSERDIFAAGDCIETYDIVRKENFINAIWPNAVEQGYYAAMNMLGNRLIYHGSIGCNSLKTKTFHLITGGILKGKDVKIYQHYSPSKNQLRKIAFRGDVPVGMAFLNDASEAGVMINLIKRGLPIDIVPEKIVSCETSLLQTLL
ncbi:MAG: FAD-dependent oxidoreductase [bacterium]